MVFVGVRQSLEKTRFGKALQGSLHRSRTHTTMSYHINREQQFLMSGGASRSVNQHLVASCATARLVVSDSYYTVTHFLRCNLIIDRVD